MPQTVPSTDSRLYVGFFFKGMHKQLNFEDNANILGGVICRILGGKMISLVIDSLLICTYFLEHYRQQPYTPVWAYCIIVPIYILMLGVNIIEQKVCHILSHTQNHTYITIYIIHTYNTYIQRTSSIVQ